MYNNRYRRRSHRVKRKSTTYDYVMPFMILLVFGVIIVLLVNIWNKVFVSSSIADAKVYFEEGSGAFKPWGTDVYVETNEASLIQQGDELKVNYNSKAMIEFFDGTIMRLGSDSELMFDLMTDDDENSIVVELIRGDLWVNRAYNAPATQATSLVINAGDLRISAESASIFSVQKSSAIAVRTLKSFEGGLGLSVDIFADDMKTVVENEIIGIAQEIVFSSEVISRFREYLKPSVLEGITPEFRESQWYLWNMEMDLNPPEVEETLVDIETIGLQKVEDEIFEEALGIQNLEEEGQESEVKSQELSVENEQEESNNEEAEKSGVEGVDSVPVKPVLTSVSGQAEPNADGFFVVNSNPAVLTGTASGASKIVVNGYTLTKFQTGDSTWTYFANADFDFMKVGENIYDVYAVGKDGERSEPLVFKVLYEPMVEVEPVVESEPEQELEPQFDPLELKG